jgi:hypothetical protein
MTNSTQKEKKLCWFGLLVLSDRALLPKCIKTSHGDFDVEPVREVNYRNRSDLIDALNSAIAIGNPSGDVPEYRLKKGPSLLETLIGAKSWADLERRSIYFSIKIFPSCCSVKCWGRGPDGKWAGEEDTILDTIIPVERGTAEIADVILEHLKTRTDLPGLQL